MKIKLIAPHEQSEQSISSAETFKIRRVSLPLLAALTPEGHNVKIVDEAFCPDNMNEEADLVGITVMTELALRAYYLADIYRRRGAKVVLGGIHPTVLPAEAMEHADAVVVGEAEETWPKVVADAQAGKLEKLYRTDREKNIEGLPRPLRHIYPLPAAKGYTPLATGVETSRGCPFDCEFCSIGHIMGHRYRLRPTAEVVAEIASMEDKNLFFVDDAFGLNRASAKKLLTEMIPLGKFWVGQGTVSLAEDPELLRLMRRSGCLGLLIGFESVQKQARQEMRKLRGAKVDPSEAVRRFHGEGIAILGAFVFGFDHEESGVFDETYEFVMKTKLDFLQLRMLVPFPGTRLYERLLGEGRLFMPEWWLKGYCTDTLLFKPKGISPTDFLEGFAWLNRQTYSYSSILRRFFGMSPMKRTAFGCRIYAGYNIATRKRYLKSLEIPQPFVPRSV